MSAKELLYLIIILMPVGILIFAFINQSASLPKPKAADGVLDLSSWNPEKGGDMNLNGEWKFYWNQLLTPSDLSAENKLTAEIISVPGIWNGHKINGHSIPADGYATYVLDVKLNAAQEMYALNLLTVSNAYKLWANDKLIAENGVVGKDAAHSVPEYRPQVIPFTPTSDHVRFILQVSNFAHCKGGCWLPIEIGTVAHVQKERDARALLEMFLFGCLFILALYHFSLYFLRRDSYTLFFGLMCLAISVRSLLTGSNLINAIMPGLDWFLERKIEYILTFVSAPLYVTFSRTLFREQWNTVIYKIIVGFGIALCLFVVFTPPHIYTLTSYVFTGYAWLTSVYTIFVFCKALMKKQEGAGIFLSTSLFFLLTIVNDTLNQLELVHTGLYLSFGLFVVTFAQSFVLSTRSANAFRLTEVYARTFRKFVPEQFLNKIAKDGIESIRPGNAEVEDATVMFSDIRSFTSLSETMTPTEVFTMLNEYLSYVEPPIRANNGFVDKYIGDGIMAIFESDKNSNGAHNGLMAALSMQEALVVFNEKRKTENKPELKMGIGLHSGPVIIGTMGGEERMDSTAVGDGVNLASRIEGMTKMYGVKLLLSERTLEMAGDTSKFLCRFVDEVKAKGKSETAKIWEVLGMRSDKKLVNETQMIPVFEEAMQFYKTLKIAEAKKKFESCVAICPGDPVSEIYLERCASYLKNGSIAIEVTTQD